MEKKTIGGFIAALRKANGMTQKDLAERLNVSDKTVSRWERDDGAPDLSAIPAIAEIFGVTCDELLRGERKSPTERAEAAEEAEPTPKAEKQRQRLLAVSLSKYKTRSFIAMGISIAGLIAAMVGNFGFLRAYIGFLIGAVFYLAGVICQAVFINGAFLSVSDDSLNPAEVGRFKWDVVKQAEWSFGLTAVLLGLSLPLVIFPNDTYVGLNADYWFGYGAMIAAVALLIVGIVCFSLNASLLKSGTCTLAEKETQIYHHNHKLKKKCAIALVVALVATLVIHVFGSEMIWSSYNISSSYGQVFNDYESFVEYMEQDIPYDSNTHYSGWAAIENPVAPESSVQHEDIEWYDKDGNVITEDEARTRTLEDANGNVVCTYIDRNESVSSIRYSAKDGTVLPIRVISTSEYRAASRLSSMITSAYCVLYPIELIAVLLVYFKKRAK